MLGTEVGQFRELYGNPDVRGAVLASVAWEVDGLGGDEWGSWGLLHCWAVEHPADQVKQWGQMWIWCSGLEDSFGT